MTKSLWQLNEAHLMSNLHHVYLRDCAENAQVTVFIVL
jgi:hypothetical protein